MPKKKLELLTESMFYVLTALNGRALCGTEIARIVETVSGGRIEVGPATLYTMLGKFLDAGYIEEVLPAAPGRIRTYCLTELGRAAWLRELDRLTLCIADAMRGNEDLLTSRVRSVPLPARQEAGPKQETEQEKNIAASVIGNGSGSGNGKEETGS